MKWLVPSKPQGSPLEERLRGSSLPPRLLVNLLQPLVAWRSPIVSGLARWLWGRSASIRRAPSFSLGSFHSRGWSGKLLRISRLISVFRAVLYLLFRRRLRLTLLGCSRILIFAPFMPRESPSCLRTFSLHVELGVKELRVCWFNVQSFCFCSGVFFNQILGVTYNEKPFVLFWLNWIICNILCYARNIKYLVFCQNCYVDFFHFNNLLVCVYLIIFSLTLNLCF